MKTELSFPDLDAADRNWIQFNVGGSNSSRGPLAEDLLHCSGFEPTAFPYQVWEISGSWSDGKPTAILLANQSTLKSALKYMKQGRVLVYNQQAAIRHNEK